MSVYFADLKLNKFAIKIKRELMKSLVEKSPIGNALKMIMLRNWLKIFLGIRYITSNQGLAIALSINVILS